MNKAEKIKAEVERRLRTIEPNLPSREEFDKVADRNPGINSDFNIGEKMGAYTMLKKVEQFIDSLEEPVKRTTADIEAAMQEVEEKSKLFTEAHKDDVVSNDTIDDLEEAACEYADGENPTCPCEECLIKTFKAGAQWQKEKMMEDTVDGEIYFNLDYLHHHINTEPLTHFHHGDKVKLVIIKKE